MSMVPTPFEKAVDPGTLRTVAQVVKNALKSHPGNRHCWGVVADKANTDFIVFSMGGDPAINVGSTDAGTTLGQAQINGVTTGATGTSFKLNAGQSFSEPVGGNAVYSGPVTVAANSGTQTFYTWEY